MAQVSKARSLANKPREVVSGFDFGMKGDATYVLNGSGVPSSWSGTDNSAALLEAVTYAKNNGIRKITIPAGYYLFGSTVEVPGYIVIEGESAHNTVFVPANTGFTGTETPIIKFNDTASDIDGVGIDQITFQMNGLNATHAIGVQFYKCNTLTKGGKLLFTQLGANAIGLDIYRGSSLFFDDLRFNGGTNSTATVLVGTNMRIRECPGVFINSINIEHADLGIKYENKADADGAPIYMPTLSINNLYCEHHTTEVVQIYADNTHLYTQPMVHINHIEARASVAAGSIVKVLPYSGVSHNVCLYIGSLQYTGAFLHAVETPTKTWDVHLANFFYKAGNQKALTKDGIVDALTDNPRLTTIKTAGTETTEKIELYTTAGLLGTIQVDNTNGRIKIFGTNGVRLADTGGLGFFGSSGGTKPTITGSRGGNAALASLLTALSTLGLVTDSTSA